MSACTECHIDGHVSANCPRFKAADTTSKVEQTAEGERYIDEASHLTESQMEYLRGLGGQNGTAAQPFTEVVEQWDGRTCPACGWRGLFIGSGGYVTCPQFDCPNPDVGGVVTQAIEEAERRARIDELTDYPLNWADNRKEKVWREMILSRLNELKETKTQ